SNLETDAGTQRPDYELYKVSAIGIATFFGTILAGGLLLSKNFKRLGKESAARDALIYSVIATVAVTALALLIPEDWNIPSFAFTVPQLVAMMQIARQQQEADIDRHIDNGGALASNWKALGISLLVLLGVMAVMIPLIMLFI